MTIKVNLSYYDKQHERLLTTTQPYASAGTGARVAAYKKVPLIRKVDFLSYLFIHRQHLPGFQTFQELQAKISRSAAWVEDVLKTPGPALQLTQQGVERSLAEHVGESVGLSVVSKMHGLTDADWTKLPELSGANPLPSFDFSIASDGIRAIQVETKALSSLTIR